MNRIEVVGQRSTITLELDTFVNDGKTMELGFRLNGSSCRVVVGVTDEELDLLEQAIRKYKREKAVETLERFKEKNK